MSVTKHRHDFKRSTACVPTRKSNAQPLSRERVFGESEWEDTGIRHAVVVGDEKVEANAASSQWEKGSRNRETWQLLHSLEVYAKLETRRSREEIAS